MTPLLRLLDLLTFHVVTESGGLFFEPPMRSVSGSFFSLRFVVPHPFPSLPLESQSGALASLQAATVGATSESCLLNTCWYS